MFTHLVTHSGAFHADDLFATAALRLLAPDAPIVRTRDLGQAFALAAAGGIVYDVGMIHDPARRLFDHHQPGRALREAMADGTEVPYSAFGLVWQAYGQDVVRHVLGDDTDPRVLRKTWEQVDRRLVVRIDMGDNGVIPESEEALRHPLSLGKVLEAFLPPFDAEADAIEGAFHTALAVADVYLQARIHGIAGEERAFQVAKDCVRKRVDPRWIELPVGMPYLGAIRAEKAEEVLYALMPDRAGIEWTVSAVRKEGGEAGCRQPFPAHWAGLRGAALTEASGVEGAVFCHMGRHLSIAGSREGALALVHAAIAHADGLALAALDAQDDPTT
jgi:uncharacterized UPF0160 family protein